jgi:hypothetical protein
LGSFRKLQIQVYSISESVIYRSPGFNFSLSGDCSIARAYYLGYISLKISYVGLARLSVHISLVHSFSTWTGRFLSIYRTGRHMRCVFSPPPIVDKYTSMRFLISFVSFPFFSFPFLFSIFQFLYFLFLVYFSSKYIFFFLFGIFFAFVSLSTISS